jgi:RNA ligase
MDSVKLSDILDIDNLRRLIGAGYISENLHNKFPLAILNYTKLAQADDNLVWDNEMSLSRGLIYNTKTNEVVAVPYRKFWDMETLTENLPDETPIFLEKLDGSMGTLYEFEGHNYVATRGSFDSVLAEWATEWLNIRYPRLKLPKLTTIIVEIIVNFNRIVVEYDFEGLVVTGAVNITTTKEIYRDYLKDYCRAMGLSIVKEYRSSLSNVLNEDVKNREGYVVNFPSTGIKVKVKFDSYKKLHRILTTSNVKSMLEQ